MMKTSMASLIALSSMLGFSNAVQLSQDLTIPDVPPGAVVDNTLVDYEPNIDVLGELFNLFTAKADHENGSRMSFAAWASLLDTMNIEPENRECSAQADSDFYEQWFAGAACTDGKPNYSNPNIVRCGAVTTFCGDPGMYRNYLQAPDTSGFDTLSHVQFNAAVESLNQELDTDKDGIVYQTLTKSALEDARLAKVQYEYVETFGDSGAGGAGFREEKITVKYGRSQDKKISHAVMARLKLTQAWIISGSAGAGEIEAKYDFTQTTNRASYKSNEYEKKVHLDFSVPNYVYNKKITMFYQNGRQETIYGGVYISHKQGGEPFVREIVYNDDGVTIKSDVKQCRECTN